MKDGWTCLSAGKEEWQEVSGGIVAGWGNEEGRRGRGGSGCLTVFSGFEESVGGVFVEERSWRVWKVL